jgi:hypothetical protein
VAQNAGATVLSENNKGYGYACLKGLDIYCSARVKPTIVVFWMVITLTILKN